MFQTVLITAEWMNIQSLFDYIKDLKKRYALHKEYKKTLDELYSLSDKELNDIGINRGMVRSVAMEIYYDNLKGTN